MIDSKTICNISGKNVKIFRKAKNYVFDTYFFCADHPLKLLNIKNSVSSIEAISYFVFVQYKYMFLFCLYIVECITFLPLGLNSKLMKCISDVQQLACADTFKTSEGVNNMIKNFFFFNHQEEQRVEGMKLTIKPNEIRNYF